MVGLPQTGGKAEVGWADRAFGGVVGSEGDRNVGKRLADEPDLEGRGGAALAGFAGRRRLRDLYSCLASLADRAVVRNGEDRDLLLLLA